jgi:hypothetical protein
MSLPTAYAVVYRPQPDGSWTAQLADMPHVQVRGADIDEVKDRIRKDGRQHVRMFGEVDVAKRTVVGYVYLDEGAEAAGG